MSGELNVRFQNLRLVYASPYIAYWRRKMAADEVQNCRQLVVRIFGKHINFSAVRAMFVFIFVAETEFAYEIHRGLVFIVRSVMISISTGRGNFARCLFCQISVINNGFSFRLFCVVGIIVHLIV